MAAIGYTIISWSADTEDASDCRTEQLKVRVQYLGYIKNMLNKKEDNFEFEKEAQLSDLLNKLAGLYGKAFEKEVYEPGINKIKTGFSVTINGVRTACRRVGRGDTWNALTLECKNTGQGH